MFFSLAAGQVAQGAGKRHGTGMFIYIYEDKPEAVGRWFA